MTEHRTIEEQLLEDRLIYGTAYYKIVDGQKVRVAHEDVYYKSRRQAWFGRLWWRVKQWLKTR